MNSKWKLRNENVSVMFVFLLCNFFQIRYRGNSEWKEMILHLCGTAQEVVHVPTEISPACLDIWGTSVVCLKNFSVTCAVSRLPLKETVERICCESIRLLCNFLSLVVKMSKISSQSDNFHILLHLWFHIHNCDFKSLVERLRYIFPNPIFPMPFSLIPFFLMDIFCNGHFH